MLVVATVVYSIVGMADNGTDEDSAEGTHRKTTPAVSANANTSGANEGDE